MSVLPLNRLFSGKPISTKQIAAEPEYRLLFRKCFDVSDFEKAVIFISSYGKCKLYVNGLPVTVCSFSSVDQRYDTIDITDYLLNGENTLAIHTVYTDGCEKQGLILDLELDGKTVLSSDGSFKAHRHTAYEISRIGTDGERISRIYDSRAAEIDFESPMFDDSEWENAYVLPDFEPVIPPAEEAQSETVPIKPVITKKLFDGYFVDFGRVYKGTLFVAASGAPGETVRILYGSTPEADGTVRLKTLENCSECDEWILSGGDDCLDVFSERSFRYAKIEAPEGASIEASDIRLIAERT